MWLHTDTFWFRMIIATNRETFWLTAFYTKFYDQNRYRDYADYEIGNDKALQQ